MSSTGDGTFTSPASWRPALLAGLSLGMRQEYWANLAFAASALLAAVMRLAITPIHDWWMPAIIGMAAINGLIAWLFLIRRPVVAMGTLPDLVSCLPTMVGFGLAIRFSPPLEHWPASAHGLFATGALLTLASFISLHRAFGVLPALRGIVIRGPYRLVRHPAYAGELLMAAACLLAGPSPLAASAWLLLLPGVVWRIISEERVLSQDAAYAAYGKRVRWRLAPCVW
jgi:protein-S-isoprenylcysteine O-methyltransferase Ste14